MSGSFEKVVKSATKLKLAPPKAKWVERILTVTRTGESGVAEVFRTLQFRVRDSTWTIAFKALIVVHLMIREGDSHDANATLSYLSNSPKKLLGVNNYTDAQTQGQNIRHYSQYLIERARSYGKTQQDYVKGAEGRLKRLTVDKGLLRETEVIQDQIRALVKCDLFSEEPENEITLTAFRLLTMDLLQLFQVMNEGAINVLEHYFEMSKPDAERALMIYKTFARQTDQVVKYLSTARQYERSTRLEIPKIKHAPTSLAASLEEYLLDKDFETNRRQYLAEKEAKKNGKAAPQRFNTSGAATKSKPAASAATAAFPAAKAPTLPKSAGPAPDLINFDFFESIEQNQQSMATEPQQQQQQQIVPQQFTSYSSQPTGYSNGFQNNFSPQQPTQSTNPFGQYQSSPLQSQSTGAGFGGYGPQPDQSFIGQPFQQQNVSMTGYGGQYAPPQQYGQQQSGATAQQPVEGSNPFRQSMMPAPTGALQPISTGHSAGNPFARSTNSGSPFSAGSMPPMPTLPTSTQTFTQQPQGLPNQQLVPQRTGTNPFAANPSPVNPHASSQNFVMSQATGSTNPFRQSAFVNHQTGQGWQTAQGTMGGLENLQTTPVFPRPGQTQQQQQQQQQHQQSPW